LNVGLTTLNVGLTMLVQ